MRVPVTTPIHRGGGPTAQASFEEERAELLRLLRSDGILYASETQPVVSRDGKKARWMLDSLKVSLTPRGNELAGRCLLTLLDRFEGRQIATYGVTGIPLLSACIGASGGKYRGIIVRKERKKHGSMKLLEGPVDKGEPVILLDDSVSSGLSMQEGTEKLTEAGLLVEGGVCLVRFGWYGGFARMMEQGLHMEALYDIWQDFIYHMPDEERPTPNLTKVLPPHTMSGDAAFDRDARIHPCVYARLAIEHYLKTGELLTPPRRLDRDYDARGGAWVSVRQKDNVYDRSARDGVWHLPGDTTASLGAPHDLALAALRTAASLPKGRAGRRLLKTAQLAVTFFSELEECTVGQLDNDRYGIVVRSLERPGWMGGALPRMPGITTSWAQLEHARRKNARLISFEPYVIYRHDVEKVVEEGAVWPKSGVPRVPSPFDDAAIGARLASRALDLARKIKGIGETTTDPLPDDLLPEGADSLYVTAYAGGRFRGCMGSKIRYLDKDLQTLVARALDDTRFTDKTGDLAVSVSILYDALELGAFSPDEVMERVRVGEQALLVHQGDRVGMLLPFVAVRSSLGPKEFAAEVIDKAGITRPPYRWCRFECATWLATAKGVAKMEGALVPGEPPLHLSDAIARFAPLVCDYMVHEQKSDGSFYSTYSPFSDQRYDGLATARLAHAAWVLGRAAEAFGHAGAGRAAAKVIPYLEGLVAQGDDGLPWIDDGRDPPTIAEVAFTLLALIAQPKRSAKRAKLAGALAQRLLRSIDDHGRFRVFRDEEHESDVYQDYAPGEALLALGQARLAGVAEVPLEGAVERALAYYRRRFRWVRSFGQVSWWAQAYAAWAAITGRGDLTAFVFEVADFTIRYQSEGHGGFWTDQQPDTPGFTTALYLEGIGAARALARRSGDEPARVRAYEASLEAGFRFLDRLVYQDRDGVLLPNLARAKGGVRASARASEVRLDFAGHMLSALVEAQTPPLPFMGDGAEG